MCRRWDTDRNDALQTAWFNGVGYVAWENIWGIWNGITPRDAAALKRVQPLLRFLGRRGMLTSELWEPHTTEAAQAGAVFASRFPESRRWGPHAAPPSPSAAPSAAPCAAWTAWTLVERSGASWPASTPMLSLDGPRYRGCFFFDLWTGARLAAADAAHGGEDRIVLSFALEARGFGGVLATSAAADQDDEGLRALLSGQRAEAAAAGELSGLDSQWQPARQEALPNPLPFVPAHTTAPVAEAVLVPSGTFHFKCSGVVIEPFESERRASLGIDVRFEWEPLARNEHEHEGLALPSFWIDRAPVGMARYAAFLRQSGYVPEDARNFLREWPDWRRGIYPSGNETVPVTGVSFREARRFCNLLRAFHWSSAGLPLAFRWPSTGLPLAFRNLPLAFHWPSSDLRLAFC